MATQRVSRLHKYILRVMFREQHPEDVLVQS